MPKKFWGCTITGKDFHALYNNHDFKYFKIDWDSGKLKIEAFNLYESLGRLSTTKTSSIDLVQKIEGELNLYKEQLEEALNRNTVTLITIMPEQSAIGELVALRIKFETSGSLITIYARLNPSPPAPPSDSFRLQTEEQSEK